MIITAHSGADGTKPNSAEFLDKMRSKAIEAIEVDVRKICGKLVCSHDNRLFPFGLLTLSDVLKFVAQKGILVNLDLKLRGLVKDVVSLAKSLNAEENIYFTGKVEKEDFGDLGKTKVYLNKDFFENYCEITTENVQKIKARIDSQGCPSLLGINVSYDIADEKFLDKCKEVGLKVSLYTVDEESALKRLLSHCELANVTTKNASLALKIKAEIQSRN